MILLLALLIITVILYLARKFGYMDVIQCVLLAIIAFGTFCPDTLRHYLFFQMNLNEILVGIPTELMNSEKINAMANVNKANLGQILSNLTNTIMDVAVQKPVHPELESQTQLLSSIKEELSSISSNTEKANDLIEVQLSQYQQGQSLALQKFDTINNSINIQGKKLSVAVNNPVGLMDTLTSINSHVKPNLAILGELNNINYTLAQEKQLLSEGFNKMLQAEGNNNLAKDIQSLSSQLSTKFDVYQANTEKTLHSMQNDIALERSENKKLLEQMHISSLADIELANEEAEKRIAAASDMANLYIKHENLGTNSYNSGVNMPKVDSNGMNQAAAAGMGLTTLSWVLKFLRIV